MESHEAENNIESVTGRRYYFTLLYFLFEISIKELLTTSKIIYVGNGVKPYNVKYGV